MHKIFRKRQHDAFIQMMQLAQLAHNDEFSPWRAHYGQFIRLIGMKTQQPLPFELKYQFCRRCNTWFTLVDKPTVRIRLRPHPTPHLVFTCLHCGAIRRRPYQPGKKRSIDSEEDSLHHTI